MANARVTEMIRTLNQDGGVFDFGPERSRLLIRVQRALAQGRPVSVEQAERFAAELGLAPDEADAFLRPLTERDADDNIVGAFALSLNAHPHRFSVDGTHLSAWCAEDTLFLPALLERTATVESPSPVSGRPIRLRVGRNGVEEVAPEGAVVSIAVVDPTPADVSSVEAIWGAFCHHIFFFASRAEAEQWAAGRADIEIVPVAEGFELGRLVASSILARAAKHDRNPEGGHA